MLPVPYTEPDFIDRVTGFINAVNDRYSTVRLAIRCPYCGLYPDLGHGKFCAVRRPGAARYLGNLEES